MLVPKEAAAAGRPATSKIVLAFVAIYFIWGTTYLAVKYAVASLPQPLLRYRASPAGISMRDNDKQRRCLREARDRLHEERPMVPVPAGQVLREGLAHTRTYGATCPGAARDYVFDHVWLAVLLARRRRVRLAAALLVGALGVVARRPTAGRALVDVVRRR